MNLLSYNRVVQMAARGAHLCGPPSKVRLL